MLLLLMSGPVFFVFSSFAVGRIKGTLEYGCHIVMLSYQLTSEITGVFQTHKLYAENMDEHLAI